MLPPLPFVLGDIQMDGRPDADGERGDTGRQDSKRTALEGLRLPCRGVNGRGVAKNALQF